MSAIPTPAGATARAAVLGLLLCGLSGCNCGTTVVPDASVPDIDQGDGGTPDAGALDAGAPDAGRCGDGVRDPGEACDPGLQGCCSATCTGVLPAEALCRPGSGACDLAERCDGVQPACPPDAHRPDWSTCSDCSADGCLGCYGGVCRPYVSPCLDALEQGRSTGDGPYEVPPWQTGGAAQTVFCDMSTDGGGWTMLYKKSAGVVGDSVDLWTDGGANADAAGLLDRARAASDYSSPLIARIWPAFADVRVEVVTASAAVRALQFRATGSTITSWFAPDRVTVSPWTDLPVSPTFEDGAGRFFSIRGSGAGNRRWYLNANWGGCAVDRGWMMISHSNFCPWEGRSADFPSEITYASGTTMGLVADPAIFRRAEALIVFAR